MSEESQKSEVNPTVAGDASGDAIAEGVASAEVAVGPAVEEASANDAPANETSASGREAIGDGILKAGVEEESSPALTPEQEAELAAAEALIDDTPVEVTPSRPIEEDAEGEEEIELNWYILKVQSNRERTSTVALKRKVAIEGIEHLFGEIIVPTEKVTEFKNGKKRIVERKIWPGYIAVQMHVNDDTWFAIRETSGIGDFTGSSGKPVPMQPHEIALILHEEEEEGTDDTPKLNIKFAEGDKVKVKDGNFENFEGEVHTIDQQSGKVTIMISIFGRSTPVELEYWQVETL